MSQNDNKICNPSAKQNAFAQVCERRFSRRDWLKISGLSLGVSALAGCASETTQPVEQTASRYHFKEISHGMDEYHHVAEGHNAQVLLRWGDPIFADAPEFDPTTQTLQSQLQQFGYNNDYIGYAPLPKKDGDEDRALLCVNHEYPIHGLMFPDYQGRESLTEQQIAISQAACGNSIVEVFKRHGQWQVDKQSTYNRRISSYQTEMQMSGPAAGHARLKTSADVSGRRVIGTFNNCAGGMTPWGTYLTCEENFNYCFGGELAADSAEQANYQRYNVPTDFFHWSKFDARFDVGKEENEANRFGWVVEIDPYDPGSTPKKRTALGRFKHEGGENILTRDGRLAIYMGDDQRFEYLYKFVTEAKVDLQNKSANADILDNGTLYVARFNDDGSLLWMPLEISNPLLTEHFDSQADILIEARRAADLLEATPMDRPEDVVPNPKTGKVYVMLTNNSKRKVPNAGNPRVKNLFGQIVEIVEADNDAGAESGRWDLLVVCGDPNNPQHQAVWNSTTSENGWFASPDNAAIDPGGRLWVSTDQGAASSLSGTNDGLWALETQGTQRGTGKMFFRVPNGAEMSGPVFADDGETLFLSVQHPGDIESKPGTARFNTATTRWPDFDDALPPRPSLVAVTRNGGGKVG